MIGAQIEEPKQLPKQSVGVIDTYPIEWYVNYIIGNVRSVIRVDGILDLPVIK